MRGCAFIIVLAACGRVGFDGRADGVPPDLCATDRVALGAWSAPTLVGPGIATSSSEDDPAPSDDGLELFFTSARPGSLGANDMYRVRRASTVDPWGPVETVVELSTTANENTPVLSGDALTMWFASDRAGGAGNDDIWVTTRADRDVMWSSPTVVAELDSPQMDRAPSLYLDELAIVFHSTRPGGPGAQDFWIATRPTRGDAWSTPVPLGSPPNTTMDELRGWMSPCGLELDFQADRGAGMDFYVSRRASAADPFGPEQRIDELSGSEYDQDLRVSPDRRHAYFASRRTGGGDLYEASR